MKRKYIVILGFALVTLMLSTKLFKNKIVIDDDNQFGKNDNTMLSMMLETDDGSGEYKATTMSSWPTDGYTFNKELSRCENGGELSWDDTKKIVIMSGNVSDKCYVYFDVNTVKPLIDYVKSKYTGVQGENSLYYHDASLTNGINDNSYRYVGGDYLLTDVGKATGATMLVGYDATATTALIDFYCNGTKSYVGFACASSYSHYYLVKGDTTQYQTYNETLNVALTKGYITKDNVKNFVCFGTDATTCPIDNLYRIIGVIDEKVKLIKWDYAKSSLLGTNGDYAREYSYSYFSGEQGESPSSNATYYWNNTTKTNTWSESNLNKVNLNTNYLNNIGTEWANKIVTTTWKVGGNTFSNIANVTPSSSYKNEIKSPSSSTTYSAKIGLMYVSEYLYSANPSYWTYMVSTSYNDGTPSNDYRATKGDNWMYGGSWEGMITRVSDGTTLAFYIDYNGFVGNNSVFIAPNSGKGIRPTFNLDTSVNYTGGTGTMDDPIRIN